MSKSRVPWSISPSSGCESLGGINGGQHTPIDDRPKRWLARTTHLGTRRFTAQGFGSGVPGQTESLIVRYRVARCCPECPGRPTPGMELGAACDSYTTGPVLNPHTLRRRELACWFNLTSSLHQESSAPGPVRIDNQSRLRLYARARATNCSYRNSALRDPRRLVTGDQG